MAGVSIDVPISELEDYLRKDGISQVVLYYELKNGKWKLVGMIPKTGGRENEM